MKIFTRLLLICLLAVRLSNTLAQSDSGEAHRPMIHFSPERHWMNDPNGMFEYKGVYHLFFQYYPGGNKWGPMHWGHATSKDLFRWKEQPIALYPDSLGYIFSGSAVVDKNNTSGFGKDGKVPIVAIFTHHDPKGADAGKQDYQNQSIAYSLDEGMTWTKYAGNPVLKNPGIIDFRDPKVRWHEDTRQWIMTLATKDRITFFASPDLKNWKKLSEFGEKVGAHGGVWECPDLFPLRYKGKNYWVLLVSINPGGPNGGSATQYFLGDFNGKEFTPRDTLTRWLDYGPDNYAGVTISSDKQTPVFIGWMSDWRYAQDVPTTRWRSAMTLPRTLSIQGEGNNLAVRTYPLDFPTSLISTRYTLKNFTFGGPPDVYNTQKDSLLRMRLTMPVTSVAIQCTNGKGEKLVFGYDHSTNQYFIDRSEAGNTDFHPDFPKIIYAPRLTSSKTLELDFILDRSSLELFDGWTSMTAIFFPTETFRITGSSIPYNFPVEWYVEMLNPARSPAK
ncbi:glycoside hydrolase family 32 protein [Flavihumibacter petaseus]|uniref:Putative exo-beta-D-fructosidase n=1 Tax=Flavihumibacter petaseus NBRC 106054 TaxID=1220578 RepID=A0A0E9MVS5_9BACT|nr:glycoside hydrolase family 32 protein [Flavihumibacter petaseus]GAO41593.1 putative exo-beta-D-fructosidase [Flavihumibacter petaseus NBRC 106054]